MMHRLGPPSTESAPCAAAPEDERAVHEALREHKWLLDAMLHQFPHGSVNVFDRDLRYLFAAGRGLQDVGLSPTRLIGNRLADLFPADSVAYVTPFYERAFAGEDVVFDLPVAGHVYTVHASPLRQGGEEIQTIVAVAQEVTGRLRAERMLTPRQCEIAAYIAQGLTNEELAERLVITPGTAANHVEHILRRLHLKNRTQLAVWAVACGLYRPRPEDARQ